MLSEGEKQAILHEAAKYPLKAAAAPEALKIVQAAHRWVSDEHLVEAAALLEMSPAQLDAVATAYNLIYRQPVGRHVILICDSVSCWIMGYPKLKAHLLGRLGIEALGETSPDGRFTLLPVPCLGLCEQAPALMIDADLHGNLTPEKMDQILSMYE